MNNKIIYGIIAIVILIAGGLTFSNYTKQNANEKATDYLKTAETEKEESTTTTPNQKQAENQTQPAVQNGEYTINAQGSRLAWVGKKTAIADWVDSGTIAVKNGKVSFKDGKLSSGEIVIAMNTITALTTGKGDGQDKLSGHLKSPDFFDATKYPETKFVIKTVEFLSESSGVQTYKLSGDLTMKDITAPFSFEGKVKMQNNSVILEAETQVNRTIWGVNYGSSKLTNAFIDDNFTLKMVVVANPIK